MRKYLPKRLLFILPGIAAFIVTVYAQNNPDWTEQAYSLSVYPVLSSAAGFLPSLVGFSVTEWVVAAFLLFCIGYIIYYIRKVIAGGGERRVGAGEHGSAASSSNAEASPKGGRVLIAYRGIVGALAIFSMVYFAFTALCGLNYHRTAFTSYTGYSIEQSSVEELQQLCASLADDLGQARSQLGNDVDLSTAGDGDFERYAQGSVAAMQDLATQYPVLERPLYSAPKPVAASLVMSKAGIAGVFFPFTLESNINADMPFFTIPSTMAHELAHQCGFMREDEANFIAYLACRQSSDPLANYSGLLLAFNHSLSALRKADPEAAATIREALPQAVQRDRAQNAQFWEQHEGAFSDASNSVNDMYLKANNQADGVSSYGRMVDLLLAEQRAATP